MTIWLLTEDAARVLTDAARMGLSPTPEQRTEFAARILASRDGSAPRNLSIAGDVAEIRVEGILTKTPDWLAMWYGGGNTTYTDIVAALALAENDPSITRAVLRVDSPGGQADGLFDAIAALNAFTKPISAVANMACSAAFGLVSNAGEIEATGPAAQFGSIGTACDYVFSSDETIVSVTNTDSPAKRPDVQTPEGKAVVVKYLDSLNELFVGWIADGRGVKPKLVTTDYGRGAILLADEAKRLGMIDTVAAPPKRSANSARSSAETKPMNLATLKAQHPEVYAAAVREGKEPAAAPSPAPTPIASAIPGGAEKKSMTKQELQAQHPELCAQLVADGASKERDRVNAHLIRGESSGDMKTALAAVEAGSEMTETLKAKYDAASQNRRDVIARGADDKNTAGVVNGAAAPAGADTGKTLLDAAADAFCGKAS